jgi:hypothetical protein
MVSFSRRTLLYGVSKICTRKKHKRLANESISRIRKIPDDVLSEERPGLRNGRQY